jgi:hypothetical protein
VAGRVAVSTFLIGVLSRTWLLLRRTRDAGPVLMVSHEQDCAAGCSGPRDGRGLLVATTIPARSSTTCSRRRCGRGDRSTAPGAGRSCIDSPRGSARACTRRQIRPEPLRWLRSGKLTTAAGTPWFPLGTDARPTSSPGSFSVPDSLGVAGLAALGPVLGALVGSLRRCGPADTAR